MTDNTGTAAPETPPQNSDTLKVTAANPPHQGPRVARARAPKTKREKKIRQRPAPPQQTLKARFDIFRDGALAQAVASFRVREGQIEMARAVADAIDHNNDRC